MKRLMMILMAMLILPTHAADVNEVCKRDALVMIILKNEENGRVDVSDPDTMRWSVVFDDDPDYDEILQNHKRILFHRELNVFSNFDEVTDMIKETHKNVLNGLKYTAEQILKKYE